MPTDLDEACAELVTVKETIKILKEREEILRTAIMTALEDEEGPIDISGHRFTLGSRTATLGWNLGELQDLLPPESLRTIAKITFKEADMKKLCKSEKVSWDTVVACKFTDQPELTLRVRKLPETPGVFGKIENQGSDTELNERKALGLLEEANNPK